MMCASRARAFVADLGRATLAVLNLEGRRIVKGGNRISVRRYVVSLEFRLRRNVNPHFSTRARQPLL
jgi:hypothetical protein